MIYYLKENILQISGRQEKTLKPSQSRGLMIGQIISMIYWMVWIKDAESGNTIYLLVGVAGIGSYFISKMRNIENSGVGKAITRFSAFLFSVMIAAANYTIILNMSGPEGRMTFVDYFYIFAILLLVVYGGFCLACHLLNYVICFLREKGWKEKEHRIQPCIIFIFAMIIISAVNVWVLLSCYYPGTLTPDSIWQIEQCLTNVYSNHHPFYHTVIIKLILNIGLWMFQDINKAVMLYSIFQIVLMASVFSYVVVSLYQMGISWLGGGYLSDVVFVNAVPYYVQFYNVERCFIWRSSGCFSGSSVQSAQRDRKQQSIELCNGFCRRYGNVPA